jgi:hypothetical protein
MVRGLRVNFRDDVFQLVPDRVAPGPRRRRSVTRRLRCWSEVLLAANSFQTELDGGTDSFRTK